ncbi:peptide deformylase, partial [Streptomyces sp. NPDC006367]|uniref:peptide deformylase n=1 Tax=Streptomyces sp. NPDC006367 TaxID=3156759 RepID=UPI0033B707D0
MPWRRTGSRCGHRCRPTSGRHGTYRRAHDFSGKGLGLAAPQIGIGRSAAVVQPPAADLIVLLNPRITAVSEEMDEKFE